MIGSRDLLKHGSTIENWLEDVNHLQQNQGYSGTAYGLWSVAESGNLLRLSTANYEVVFVSQ